MKEKTLKLKKLIELPKQNTYEKKNKKHKIGRFDINERETRNRKKN